ncbi:Retrotransposable element tf2 155 kda protein type 1-like, partial [Rhizoctonia solani]
MGRALSVPLQSTFRGLSQTLGPAPVKSKLLAPEKWKPKKWRQVYLEKLLNGDDKPTLESWNTFEAAFLCNWSNPAAAQIAEQCLHKLKQLKSASNNATEFKIIASKLEWSDPALIVSFNMEEDKQPPYGPTYSMTPAGREALKEGIDSELAAGKIVPTISPAGAPEMFVKRADGRLCLVVDYCRLNAITIKDRYALPRQDKLIEKLHHAKIFTKLDLRNGYHNIRIKEGDEWKAAFCTALGHFAPTVMQFGLSNAPAVLEEHVEHVKEVLSCLLKHNLFYNLDKCYFFVREVTYIGLVTPEGISMEKDKVQAIMDWPEPQNVKQLLLLSTPLNNLTQKEQPWIWLEEQKAVFDAIKAEICKEPVLAHPDESKPYTLETDASGAAMALTGNQLEPSTGIMRAGISCWGPTTSSLLINLGNKPSPQVMIPESHFEAFSAHMNSSLLDQIKEATQEDPSLDTILLAVSDPKSMPHSVAQKFKDYTIQKGLLLYQEE